MASISTVGRTGGRKLASNHAHGEEAGAHS